MNEAKGAIAKMFSNLSLKSQKTLDLILSSMFFFSVSLVLTQLMMSPSQSAAFTRNSPSHEYGPPTKILHIRTGEQSLVLLSLGELGSCIS